MSHTFKHKFIMSKSSFTDLGTTQLQRLCLFSGCSELRVLFSNLTRLRSQYKGEETKATCKRVRVNSSTILRPLLGSLTPCVPLSTLPRELQQLTKELIAVRYKLRTLHQKTPVSKIDDNGDDNISVVSMEEMELISHLAFSPCPLTQEAVDDVKRLQVVNQVSEGNTKRYDEENTHISTSSSSVSKTNISRVCIKTGFHGSKKRIFVDDEKEEEEDEEAEEEEEEEKVENVTLENKHNEGVIPLASSLEFVDRIIMYMEKIKLEPDEDIVNGMIRDIHMFAVAFKDELLHV